MRIGRIGDDRGAARVHGHHFHWHPDDRCAFGGGGRQQSRRGADLRYDMEVTLEEAFHGKSSEIEIEVSQSCGTCAGSGATPGTTGENPPLPPAAHGSAPKLEELELLWDPLFEVSSRRWVGLTARLGWRRPGGALAGAADLWRAATRAGIRSQSTGR